MQLDAGCRHKIMHNRMSSSSSSSSPSSSSCSSPSQIKLGKKVDQQSSKSYSVGGWVPSTVRRSDLLGSFIKAKISAQQHRRRRYDILCKFLIALSELLLLEKSVAKAFLPMLGRVPLAVSICFINQPCSSFLCFQRRKN